MFQVFKMPWKCDVKSIKTAVIQRFLCFSADATDLCETGLVCRLGFLSLRALRGAARWRRHVSAGPAPSTPLFGVLLAAQDVVAVGARVRRGVPPLDS